MDSAIGIRGSSFAMVAADMKVTTSIMVVKEGHDKFRVLDDRMVMLSTGDQGSACRNMLYIAEDAMYESLQNAIELSPRVLAYMIQKRVHGSLRKSPLDVSSIVAGRATCGYDLWSVDRYGAMCSVPFCASGYAAYFVYGIFDREYSEDMDVDSALGIVQRCVNLLRERLVLNLEGFMVKIVTDEGVSSRVVAPEIKNG